VEKKLIELRKKHQEIINKLQALEEQKKVLINEGVRIEGQIDLLEQMLKEKKDDKGVSEKKAE